MERRPRCYVTIEGYAVEGGLDGPYQPSTCYRPTIALGRHAAPGEADDLWRDYERVLDLIPAMGFDGVRLSVEWARVEPHRGQVAVEALERYAEVVRYAQSLELGVSVAIVDAAWPAWLGLEAWLLPWVAPLVIEHTRRVLRAIPSAEGVVVFADPSSLVRGFLDSSAPPWRRGAKVDAAMARAQIDAILGTLGEDSFVGPKLVARTTSVRIDQPSDQIRTALASGCDELYVRSLLRGHGPSASVGLVVKGPEGWSDEAPEELFEILR